MSESITTGFIGVTNFVVDFIIGITSFVANILSNIGLREIFILILIGFCIYFWANQHNLAPIKIKPRF